MYCSSYVIEVEAIALTQLNYTTVQGASDPRINAEAMHLFALAPPAGTDGARNTSADTLGAAVVGTERRGRVALGVGAAGARKICQHPPSGCWAALQTYRSTRLLSASASGTAAAEAKATARKRPKAVVKKRILVDAVVGLGGRCGGLIWLLEGEGEEGELKSARRGFKYCREAPVVRSVEDQGLLYSFDTTYPTS